MKPLSRRRFLGASGGAVAAAALAPAAAMAKGAALAAPSAARAGTSGLLPREHIGIQLFTVRDQVSSQGFAKVFERLSSIGFKEVEFAGFTQGTGPITTKQIRRLMDDNGLRGIGAHTSINQNNANQVLDDAQTLGLPYVGIAFAIPVHGVTVDGWKQLAEDYNRVGALTAARGIRWYLHIHGPEYAPTADNPTTRGMDVLLAETDPALVFFQMDIFWAYFGQSYFGSTPVLPFEPLDYVKAQPARFPLFHVKDGKKNRAGGYHNAEITDVGQGHIDFQAFFCALNRWRHRYIMERDNASDHSHGSMGSALCSYLYMRYGLVNC
jgi:sugar phosphate isomerase/epimerase